MSKEEVLDAIAGGRVAVHEHDQPGVPVTNRLTLLFPDDRVSLEGVRLPADAVLPEVASLRGPLSCLNEARYGIVFGTLGAARPKHSAPRYPQPPAIKLPHKYPQPPDILTRHP